MTSTRSKEKFLPANVADWKRLARSWRTTGGINKLGSPDPVRSASTFKFEHFLGLEIIYESSKSQSRFPMTVIRQFPSFVDSGLKDLSGWDAYLDEIERFSKSGVTQNSASQICVPRTLGAFINVWQLQLHVLLGDRVAADLSKISEVIPVAHRTRAGIKRRNPHLTPTPATRVKENFLSDKVAGLSIKSDSFDSAVEAEGNVIDQDEDQPEEGTARQLETLSDDSSDAEPGMCSPTLSCLVAILESRPCLGSSRV